MRPKNSPLASKGKVSGPVVVLTLFFTAFLLFGIVFLVAYRQKISDQGAQSAMNASEYADSATAIPLINNWLSKVPTEWVKVTSVEGQGFVLFIPCYSSNPELSLISNADSLPRLECENCDSVGSYRIKNLARVREDSSLEIRLEQTTGRLRIIPVTDSLLLKYPQAPFRDEQLVWIRPDASGKVDTSIFVPKSLAGEFETLRAEDENPEGCGTEPID